MGQICLKQANFNCLVEGSTNGLEPSIQFITMRKLS